MITRGFQGRRIPSEPKRLPPGQHLTSDFPVLSAGATPDTPLHAWSFALEAEDGTTIASWSWDEFRALGPTEVTVDIHCVTRWSKFDTDWRGIAVERIFAAAGLEEPPSPFISRINRSFSSKELQMKKHDVSHRAIAGFAVCFTIGLGVVTMAQHSGSGQVKVTQLSQREIIEKLDGKDTGATVSIVTIGPGQKDSAHRHTGPVFGYVLEGEYEHAIDNEPIKTYKAGETFYEPSGSVHRVAHNPSGKTETRLLAVILHPRDATQVTVREKDKE